VTREEPAREPRPKAQKSFDISKWAVKAAYKKVKANAGAAGVDEVSLQRFDEDLKDNLYKIWNRMSSGTYFPPPVLAVEIPKKQGGVRTLGVPTVSDRIAQSVVAMYLEPEVEPIFHPDSYGYRPGRSALDAVASCRKRCQKIDWVIDLDIRAFFDSIDHDLLMRAVAKHTDLAWVLLYIRRWLKAPLQKEDGTLVERDRGTPQGSAISPLLANIFLHYVFDKWMAEQYPEICFERYADDVVVHCVNKGQAKRTLAAISERFARCHLELHPDKTRIVYCKDETRKGHHDQVSFDFLGFTFRRRGCRNAEGKVFDGFVPAVSDSAAKAIRQQIRCWRLHWRTDQSLVELASRINPIVRGWINYYGRFYRSWLYNRSLRRINAYLVRWAQWKYKRLRHHARRAWAWLNAVHDRSPSLFAHWAIGGVC
jgi:RNA-directed DNA polymerase